MPHSVFIGRPAPAPGEPMFLKEDTAAAVALAEEEQDTCPSCGMPKAWCRTEDGTAGLGLFEAHEERCWATYRLALRREALEKAGAHPTSLHAMQLSARFREGRQPDIEAGLGFGSITKDRDQPDDGPDKA